MPSFQPWVIELTNIISNFAVAIAAILGILSLWQWRKELIGKTKFEVARKMMLLALQFRDEYGRARNPWTDAGEWIERKKDDNESKNETQVLNEYFARSRRLVPLQDTLRKFYEVSWEAEVTLTEKDAELVQLFEKLFEDLYITMEMFFEAQLNQAKDSVLVNHASNIDEEQIRNWRKIIYGIRDDEFSKLADDAANTVKKRLKKYIR